MYWEATQFSCIKGYCLIFVLILFWLSVAHVPGRAGGGWESDDDEDVENLGNGKRSDFIFKPSSADFTNDTCAPLKDQWVNINNRCKQRILHSIKLSNVCFRFDHSEDNASLFEVQEILIEFCNNPGFSSMNELDKACAK